MSKNNEVVGVLCGTCPPQFLAEEDDLLQSRPDCSMIFWGMQICGKEFRAKTDKGAKAAKGNRKFNHKEQGTLRCGFNHQDTKAPREKTTDETLMR